MVCWPSMFYVQPVGVPTAASAHVCRFVLHIVRSCASLEESAHQSQVFSACTYAGRHP